MRGLIGHPLSHSYSPYIHKQIIDKEYELYDLLESDVVKLLEDKNFDCLNVTIPYKELVIDYLDELTETAKELKVVNCIKNINNKIIGHNTDYQGFMWLLSNNKVDLTNMNVAILGSGGASKAIIKAVLSYDINSMYIVSSSFKENTITYENLYEISNKIDCIINTTPVGMFPNMDESVVDIEKFNSLKVVIDIIYNPFRTKLMIDALNKDIKVVGGIDMLVAQAVKAVEFFEDIVVDDSKINEIINSIVNMKRNIVLIGMPGSGKTTIGKKLSERLGIKLYEVDELIEEKINTSIKDYFEKYGEQEFRKIEKEVIESLQSKTSSIISCGGGVVKDIGNMNYLRKNGHIIFLDRDIEKISISNKRPLTKNKEDLMKLFNERVSLYRKYSDVVINNNKKATNALEQIKREMKL